MEKKILLILMSLIILGLIGQVVLPAASRDLGKKPRQSSAALHPI
jgi:hypothetical protein